MPLVTPSSAEEVAETLRGAASHCQAITAFGNDSKRLMGGPLLPSDITLSTSKLRRVLQYEPNDLTVSVEAGMPFADLQALLARHGQMIGLDPPHAPEATIGGIVASNSCGPMRRAFGSARDLVIGMSFATLEGKLIKTGGMVVKNVAGLDMGKLMIGSFGTLAVLTSVNFRVHARPAETRTFCFSHPDLDSALAKREAIAGGVLQPLAVDLLSPAASARLGYRGYLLAIRAAGSPAVLARYGRELANSDMLTGDRDAQFWSQIQNFSPEFLRRQPGGIILRVSSTLSEIGGVLRLVTGSSISRAASGVSYIYVTSWQAVAGIWKAAAGRGWSAVIEYAPDEIRASKDLWLAPAEGEPPAFAMMKAVKHMFDPGSLLNRNRLYGRI